jgi:hypothetical protein
MFIIESGIIKKERKDGQKTQLKKGDVSGLLHFFQKDPSAATLTVYETQKRPNCFFCFALFDCLF